MVARVTRRLPGFNFEARSPQLDQTLPRMDIAVFVGFAASGPLHTPVALEDPEQFAQVFGVDALLAWDADRCRQVKAHLGPAVRSFFRNGGKRCWVIRVATDEASYNFFPIPGLAMAEVDGSGKVTDISPAFARARSEGSWSDSLRVSSALLTEPFEVTSIFRAGGSAEGFPKDSLAVELRALAGDIAIGDLLRLSFNDNNGKTTLVAMLVVETVADASDNSPTDPHLVVGGTREVWLTPADQSQSHGTTSGSARVYVRAAVNGDPSSPFPVSDQFDAEIHWPTGEREELEVFLRAQMEHAPAAGTVVWLSDGGQTSLMAVSDSGPGDSSLSGRAVRILGQGYQVLQAPPTALPAFRPVAERLTFELWVRRGVDEVARLGDLGFDAGHSRFWGDLPTDRELYRQPANGGSAGAVEAGRVALAFDKQLSELGEDGRARRFPLAGAGPGTGVYFPVEMTAIPVNYLARFETSGLPLERDGLSKFDASLFLDGDLVEPGTTSFSGQADFIRYTSSRPRELYGAHAAFGIEEGTIIAAPDAIHRGWERAAELPRPHSVPSKPIPRPEWWHFRDCKDKANQQNIPLALSPERGNFLSCDVDQPDPPCLDLSDPDSSGSFTLEWSMCSPPSAAAADDLFVLEQATNAEFTDAAVIYAGGNDTYSVYGRAPGEYFFRVRVESAGKTSNWSDGKGVRVPEGHAYELTNVGLYSSRTLLAVHRALLRMCAARGDLFAVLSIPEHYREDEAESYVKTLKSSTAAAIEVNSSLRIEVEGAVEIRRVTASSMPLGAGESGDFSHAAVYHPWLIGGEEDDRFSGSPPDGVACGVIAARTLSRGAWIAPANKAMRGPVALTPKINSERWLDLQDARINIIRQDPRGFLSMSADTLADDDDLRPINVRRLLSLLRRLALSLGATYVFEPNDAVFRRGVQRGFEAMLGEMFVRGAFAGGTPQTSFQVVTGDSLNTPQSLDLGRFIVELRVAPSLPMTFLTIRLVQTGDRSLVVETR